MSDKLLVINAHPRIGLNPNAEISALSYKEQGLADEANVVDEAKKKEIKETYEKLAVLNDKYEAKFGFKFVEFVAGRPKKAIVPVLEARLNNDAKTELQTGLEAMTVIARDRLKKLPVQSNL